jgi:hypothetical protein
MFERGRKAWPFVVLLLLAPGCLAAAYYAEHSFKRQSARGERVSEARPPAEAEGREEPRRLYPVRLNGKTGFIDGAGRLVIPPKFEYGSLWMGGVFSDGMARTQAVTQERPGYCCRFGYINSAGRVVAEPQYWEAKDFSEGLAAVKVGDHWGYIDREGRTALGPKWLAAGSFSEGLASVAEEGGGQGYIDHSGRTVIKLEGATAPGEFHEGMAQVIVADGPKGGYFSSEGRFQYGYIDREGRLAIPGPFEKAEDFSDGLAAVKVRGKMGFVDGTGRFAVEPVYDSVRSFSEGSALVSSGGKHWLIDKSGKKVADCPALSCDFSEGLAPAQVGRRWGYIDRTGRLVIRPQFHEAYQFSGGIAKVKPSFDRMGYIDKTGKYVWTPSK